MKTLFALCVLLFGAGMVICSVALSLVAFDMLTLSPKVVSALSLFGAMGACDALAVTLARKL